MEDKINEIKYEEDFEKMRCRGVEIVDYDLYKESKKNYEQLLLLVIFLSFMIFLILGIYSGYQLGISKGFAMGFIAG